MRHWTPNQKLTTEQIKTIKFLKDNGVKLSLIAQIVSETYNVSVSIVYYHASENREAYEYSARKIKEAQTQKIKKRIYDMIEQGFNTGQIAKDWNMELATVNKIYLK